MVANIEGKNTTRPNFCYHMCAGDHCTMKSIRQFLKGEKNSSERLFFAKHQQGQGSVKYKFMNLSLTPPYCRVNWVFSTEFYCLINKEVLTDFLL